MYHVNADNAFPYRLCSGQQESGSACVSSRGDDGEVTIREWHPVAAEEYGYVVPDPLDPNIVFGGKLTRYDRRTAQTQNIMPKPFRGPDFRVLRTEPIVFSPRDPHTLYFATNTLWRTRDAGHSWQQVSPDLTRKDFALPATIGIFSNEPTAKAIQRGVIYAVAISPIDDNRIWAGTDDGLVHLSRDRGRTWQPVTELPCPAKMPGPMLPSAVQSTTFPPTPQENPNLPEAPPVAERMMGGTPKVTGLLGETSVAPLVGVTESSLGTGGGGMYTAVLKLPETVAKTWPDALAN
jgi:hypothetical protein